MSHRIQIDDFLEHYESAAGIRWGSDKVSFAGSIPAIVAKIWETVYSKTENYG